uniref:RING finger protein n=1 Tax=Gemmiger formicilis TaxID=745368 RepID=UPI004028DE46
MTRYTGNHCPVCEQAFTDEDDIVVCPDCGTPYHRACWQKVGACMHKSEHAAGFEWQPEFGPDAEKAAHEATCPNCGTHNQPGAAQCSHCGCPLPKDDGPRPDPKDEDAQVPIYTRDPSTVHKPDNSRTAPGPRIDTYTADDNGGICRREIGPEDTIDGIKAKDWAAYVGRSPMYYLMQFFRMSITKQKVTVCLSAFLFGPAYLLYRKMWKEGLLTALLSIVLSVPSLIAIVATFNPSLFGSMPLHWVPVAADVCAIADWIVRILLGLFSVWLYRNTSKKNIDKIYSEYPEGDARTDALLQKGGTSIWAALLYFGIVLLLSSLVINLAGPGFVQYAMAMAGY